MHPGWAALCIPEDGTDLKLKRSWGAKLKSENLIEVYDFQEEKGNLILIMEYAPKGNLAEKIEHSQDAEKPFSVEEVVHIGIDMAQGLTLLHKKGCGS